MKKPVTTTLEKFPEYEILSVREPSALKDMGKQIRALFTQMRVRELEPAGPVFAVYYKKPEGDAPVDYEMCLPVAGPSNVLDSLKDFGGDQCVKLRYKGAYSGLGQAYEALEADIKHRGLELAGPPREVYVRGPLLGILPTMVTDIYFPVKEPA